MSYFTDRFEAHLASVNMSEYKVAQALGIHQSQISNWKRRRISDEAIRKIASVDSLNLTEDRMIAWRMVDDYGPEQLKKVIQWLQDSGLRD